MFHNGWSLNKSSDMFHKLAGLAFKGHKLLGVPLISYLQKLWLTYVNDGLYPEKDIAEALKAVFGETRSIIDCSYATATGTKIGIPVATVEDNPTCRLFTNDNGGTGSGNGMCLSKIRWQALMQQYSPSYRASGGIRKSASLGDVSFPRVSP